MSNLPAPFEGHEPPLTIEEAAAFLNVTERWIRRAVYESRLSYYKIGHNVRLSLDDLRAYLASTRVEAPAPAPMVSRAPLPLRPSGLPGGTRRPGDRWTRRPGEPPAGRPGSGGRSG